MSIITISLCGHHIYIDMTYEFRSIGLLVTIYLITYFEWMAKYNDDDSKILLLDCKFLDWKYFFLINWSRLKTKWTLKSVLCFVLKSSQILYIAWYIFGLAIDILVRLKFNKKLIHKSQKYFMIITLGENFQGKIVYFKFHFFPTFL